MQQCPAHVFTGSRNFHCVEADGCGAPRRGSPTRRVYAAVAAGALLALLDAGSVAAQAPVNDTSPGAQRVAELVELVNSGDRTASRTYVQANYAESFLRIPLERHVGILSEMHDRSRGVEVETVEQNSPAEVSAVVRHRLTGLRDLLLLRLEPEPPHRIAGIGVRPAPPAPGTSTTPRSDAELAGALDEFVETLAQADLFAGTVLLARNGEPIFAKAYGLANRDFGVPNRLDTKFNLGSMNKMFTAVAIAQLAEQGRLSFTDPLSKYLPEFSSTGAAGKIRIEHLLTHTSGLGSYFNQQFQQASRARFRTVDEFLELAADDPLAFEPGTRWGYSNTGFLVLGKIIELVSGQSYSDYVREHIYEPAGMSNTGEYELDRVNPNLAVGYQKEYDDAGPFFRNNLFEHVVRGGPAGGGYSTAEDLLRFARALHAGTLVGSEYVGLLTTPKPELGSPAYGYGFVISPNGAVGHTGGFPGISSMLEMHPNGYTVVVLANQGGAAMPVSMKLGELLPARAR
jgi:CubicO group peptidase (beta-lactamase class C family)